jgi:acyl-CoA dehydrogenase
MNLITGRAGDPEDIALLDGEGDVVDRALQVHGSLGSSGNMPLESMYRVACLASLVDGANEVHKVTIAKSELSRYVAAEGWPSQHIPSRLATARARFAHLLEASS